jgi:hypothetical protein
VSNAHKVLTTHSSCCVNLFVLLELTDSRVTLSVISIFLLSEIHTVVGMQVVLQGQVLNRYTDQAVAKFVSGDHFVDEVCVFSS